MLRFPVPPHPGLGKSSHSRALCSCSELLNYLSLAALRFVFFFLIPSVTGRNKLLKDKESEYVELAIGMRGIA